MFESIGRLRDVNDGKLLSKSTVPLDRAFVFFPNMAGLLLAQDFQLRRFNFFPNPYTTIQQKKLNSKELVTNYHLIHLRKDEK